MEHAANVLMIYPCVDSLMFMSLFDESDEMSTIVQHLKLEKGHRMYW